MDLITRKEAEAVLGVKGSKFIYRTMRNGVIPEKQEIRKGKVFNLYDKEKIINLKEKLDKTTQ